MIATNIINTTATAAHAAADARWALPTAPTQGDLHIARLYAAFARQAAYKAYNVAARHPISRRICAAAAGAVDTADLTDARIAYLRRRLPAPINTI